MNEIWSPEYRTFLMKNWAQLAWNQSTINTNNNNTNNRQYNEFIMSLESQIQPSDIYTLSNSAIASIGTKFRFLIVFFNYM